jgi:hypothetical protein
MASLATNTTSDIIQEHIDWLDREKNGNRSLEQIKIRRLQCLYQIILEVDKQINNFYDDTGLELDPKHQAFSFLFSSDFLPRNVDSTDDDGKLFNIIWFIVKTIISSDIFQFNTGSEEKKIFYEKDKESGWKQKVYFYTQLVDDNTPSAAAADVPAPEDGRDYPWVALLFLARRLITHKKTGKDGKFLPLKRYEPMQFGGGWVGQTDGTGEFQPPDHKIIFGVNLHEYEKDLTMMMQSLQLKYIPTVIEMQNILTIMILLEHELIHVAYGIYRNVENYSETRLATLDDFPRLNLPKGTKWSKSKYEFPTEQAFTDTGGHGPLFSKYANLLFGFLGQQSPLDEMSKEKRKRGEIQRDHYTTHAIISKDQSHNIPPTQGGRRKTRKRRTRKKRGGRRKSRRKRGRGKRGRRTRKKKRRKK